MATVAAAVARPRGERRPSDQFRIKAGSMLTFDQLSQQNEVAERGIVKKVVRRNIKRNQGCMALPLTIAYFVFYAISARLHEDITNVFFMESEMRQTISGSLELVDTIPGIWEYLQGDFADLFFVQEDMYGETLPNRETPQGTPGDKWGDWGRVMTYNQIQGLIRVECSRESKVNFFSPPEGTNYVRPFEEGPMPQILTDLEITQEGFRPIRDMINFGVGGTRRLEENATSQTWEEKEAEAERRLRLTTSSMRSSLPYRDKDEQDRFRFWLYPSESKAMTLERLQYFQAKRWLDETTKSMVITVYLLNPDLGRPRLIEVKIVFGFSRAGGIFFEVDLQTMMLKMFPGFLSMLSDFIWFVLLVITSMWRWQMLWRAFVKGHFLDHVMNMWTFCEWLVIFAGWFNVYGFGSQTRLITDLTGSMEEVRKLQWTGTLAEYRLRTLEMYEVAQKVSYQLGWIRVLMAQYCIVLMFRFFVTFNAQPRLALVVQTLWVTLPDLLHFVIVFMPTFMAYVISGNLIFGRRMENFSTVQASFATCFRIIMECEYDWDTLASEFYWTTGIWIWSFIVLIVLLMLNMVLAIVLDIYNDVRAASQSGEMVWTTLYHYWQRLMEMKTWVPDIIIDEHINLDMQDKLMITKEDFRDDFPEMPDAELNLLFENCANDMTWETNKYLDKTTSLKMSGAVKLTSDKLNVMVNTMALEADPLHTFTATKPQNAKMAKRNAQKESMFLTSPAKLKGNRFPRITTPGMVNKQFECPEDAPEWLVEVSDLLTRQKKWMLHVNYELQNLQWQMQMSHLRNKGDTKGTAL